MPKSRKQTIEEIRHNNSLMQDHNIRSRIPTKREQELAKKRTEHSLNKRFKEPEL